MISSSNAKWQVEVFYDGACPLCLREIKLLRWLDSKQTIRFTNIAAPAFAAADLGKTMQEFMDEIHGRTADGRWIVGVEVFRRLYAAVGFGPLAWLSRLPGISHLLEMSYRVFARNRLRLTGRCNAEICEVS